MSSPCIERDLQTLVMITYIFISEASDGYREGPFA